MLEKVCSFFFFLPPLLFLLLFLDLLLILHFSLASLLNCLLRTGDKSTKNKKAANKTISTDGIDIHTYNFNCPVNESGKPAADGKLTQLVRFTFLFFLFLSPFFLSLSLVSPIFAHFILFKVLQPGILEGKRSIIPHTSSFFLIEVSML